MFRPAAACLVFVVVMGWLLQGGTSRLVAAGPPAASTAPSPLNRDDERTAHSLITAGRGFLELRQPSEQVTLANDILGQIAGTSFDGLPRVRGFAEAVRTWRETIRAHCAWKEGKVETVRTEDLKDLGGGLSIYVGTAGIDAVAGVRAARVMKRDEARGQSLVRLIELSPRDGSDQNQIQEQLKALGKAFEEMRLDLLGRFSKPLPPRVHDSQWTWYWEAKGCKVYMWLGKDGKLVAQHVYNAGKQWPGTDGSEWFEGTWDYSLGKLTLTYKTIIWPRLLWAPISSPYPLVLIAQGGVKQISDDEIDVAGPDGRAVLLRSDGIYRRDW